MTATRDPDRIIRAWLDLMPDEVPERTVDAVLKAADSTPQARRWIAGTWRPANMTRLALASAAAIVVATGLILFAPRAVGPGVSPSSSLPAPSASIGSSPTPGASTASTPVAAALRTSWIAEADAIPALGAPGPTIGFVVNTAGNGLSIRASGGVLSALRSTATSPAADLMRLTLDRAASGCATGDVGTYRWTATPDGLRLTLAALDDACAVRQQALERTWLRSHVGSSSGGAGIVAAFDPAFLMTLPVDGWQATTYADVIELSSPLLYIYAGKDPQGFTAPCTAGGGDNLAIEPGLDAFEAYVRSIPTLTVRASEGTVGGYPARHLDITSTPTAACPRGTPIIQWRAKAEPGTLNWLLSSGDPDSMDLVALPDATILLQLIPQTETTVDTDSVVDSIRFVESLSDVASPAPS